MTALTWGAIGLHKFETGLDRGVLYTTSGVGVAWNGLTSVTEKNAGQETTPLYFDGAKYLDYVGPSEFAGTIKALTYPDEFLIHDGIATSSNNILLDNQVRTPFGLSYRTGLGNDLLDLSYGYKIHILYNLTAVPSDVERQSVGDNTEPFEFEWSVTSRPQTVANRRPSAHIVISSKKVTSGVLTAAENILYGTGGTNPRLPTITELLALT